MEKVILIGSIFFLWISGFVVLAAPFELWGVLGGIGSLLLPGIVHIVAVFMLGEPFYFWALGIFFAGLILFAVSCSLKDLPNARNEGPPPTDVRADAE